MILRATSPRHLQVNQNMTLFQNKYRVESTRLSGWDYSAPGFYFVTFCTHNRECLLGTVRDGRMVCNTFGDIVREEWRVTGEKNVHIMMDEFVVMPNHFHGIIQILFRSSSSFYRCRDVARNVSTNATEQSIGAGNRPANATAQSVTTDDRPTTAAIQSAGTKNERMSAISPTAGSLSFVVRQMKSSMTKRINDVRHTPGVKIFQSRFHDHIIRDPDELERIRRYIRRNPVNWDADRFHGGVGCVVHEPGVGYEQEIWMI